MLLDDLIRRGRTLFASATAITDGFRSASFEVLAHEVHRLAAGLHARGIQPGDRVAVLGRNRIEYAVTYFALARIGAVAVPLNWRLRTTELGALLLDSRAVAVLAEADFHPVLADLRESIPTVTLWADLSGAAEGWVAWDELSADTASPHRGSSRDVFVQMYTSGTTGRPKGAMLTHDNLMSLMHSWLLEMPVQPGDRFLQVTPLFHVGALLMLVSNIASGSTLLLHREFAPAAAARALSDDRVTHALLVPSMIAWLLMEPGVKERVFPDLRLVIYGASPMPPDVLRPALEVLGCGFLQGYGLTETAGVVTTLRPEDHVLPEDGSVPDRLLSAGREILGVEIAVVDDDGARVPTGTIGEVVARGANITPGYWQMPEATADALRDGWLWTGDLGHLDDDGYLTLVDRKKDMIIVGGENVYPREIENALREHPAVQDAAVIGIPHKVWGEQVLAVVVADDTPRLDRLLIRHCRDRLARFKCPTRVERVDAIPRNAAGKILKNELRAPYWATRRRNV